MKLICILFFAIMFTRVPAQINITIEECEKSFLKNNLELLTYQYNIDIAKEGVKQAKIWDLPVVSTSLNAFNPDSNKVFDIGRRGQKVFAISQLLYLGGKKKKEAAFATSNLALRQLKFKDLIRNLSLELKQTFYEIFFEEQKNKTIKNQLTHLDSLLKRYTVQVEKGNIPLKELVRLQALFFNLKSESIAIEKNLIEQKAKLNLITGLSEDLTPTMNIDERINKISIKNMLSLDSMVQRALQNRADYLLTDEQIKNAEKYLKWQKSLSVPDINLGLEYDQNGGAFKNQTSLTLSIPLPIWNKNKGNIKMATFQIQQAFAEKNKIKQEIFNEVKQLYLQYLNAYQQYQMISTTNINQFEFVYNGMLVNFEKRNISIFEFTDFIESYKQSFLQIKEIQKQFFISIEKLLYAIQNPNALYE